jgi:glycine/D-amino acid oxidase-like deaminating enzyme
MDLRSGCPFWILQAGEKAAWPDLESDASADVLVIGGGVTGALAAWRLADAGLDTLLLDRREIGQGSTAASTGLLQYELDTPLTSLREQVGAGRAERAYRRCAEAFGELESLLEQLGDPAGYARRPSLYLARERQELAGLRRECEARAGLGIAVEYLERAEVQSAFGIDRPGAIRSEIGGELDAYRLTLRLADAAAALGARLRTGPASEVTSLEAGDPVIARTAGGKTIRAGRVVVATGYEFAPCLSPRSVTLHSTYAVASRPHANGGAWPERAIIWETARPYLYLRTTADGRVIVGGADESFSDVKRRDALLGDKTAHLIEAAHELMPSLHLEADCAWAGVFAETPDGLPYIGAVPGAKNIFGSLAYGGNGITFGVIASAILLGLCREGRHADAELFGFARAP